MNAHQRVAVVTGASDGIGRVIAMNLVENGYQVAALARSTKKLNELAGPVGVHPFPLDVTDEDGERGDLAR